MNRIAFFLLFALHSVIPAVCVLLYGAAPYWLLGNLLFCLALLTANGPAGRRVSLLLLSLASAAWALLTVLLGISYYLQGSGFNDQFIYHLRLDSLAIAIDAYGAVFLPAVAYILLAAATPYMVSRLTPPERAARVPAMALWLLAMLANYPLHSFIGYQLAPDHDDSVPVMPGELAAARSDPETPSTELPAREQHTLAARGDEDNAHRKNIILVYAEGLEQLFFRQEVFGELLPRLTELARQSRRFTNVYQAGGTGWTIAGIVASQCGFPMVVSNPLANNSSMAAVENPYADARCLADILLAAGYTTVYMGGAPLNFAGKGNFLRSHGYRKVLGSNVLQGRLEDPDYIAGFGLYDDSLFAMALQELRELERAAEPYLLTLLTLDSHHPYGRPSSSCTPLPDNPDPMSNAIYCSDQLISQFIEDTLGLVDPEDTIVVLMSDHLSLRNTLWEKIRQHRQDRRLLLMLFDDEPPGESDLAMSHFDVAPTILQAAGFTGIARLGVGVSAFARSGAEASAKPARVDVSTAPPLLLTKDSAADAGILISRQDLTFKIGHAAITATDAGRSIDSGLFLLVLNDQGNVIDTVFTRDSAAMLEALAGKFVVGISLPGSGGNQGDEYFYGWMSDKPGDLTVRAFDTDAHISPADIITGLRR